MSSIIFSQLSRNLKPNGVGFEEEEEEEEQPTSFANEFESPNYEVHLYKNLKNTNKLINVIVHERNQDYVVIRLKKNQEFSFGVKHFTENKVHYTNNIYCEDKYVLSYIDNGEIPPLLADIIDEWWCFKWEEENSAIKTELDETESGIPRENPINHYSNVYYNGCILAEIRNHRLPSRNPESFLSYFILLKPSRLNHQNEINKIMLTTNHKFKWNNKALMELESSLIQANAPKLYLGLNPNVYALARKFARRKDILCENQFVRMRRKRLKRSLPLDLSTAKSFSLLNFIRANPRPKLAPMVIPSNTINDHEMFRSYGYKDITMLAKEPNDEDSICEDMVKFEEYNIDHLDNSNCARIVIFHKAVDNTYYGTLLHSKESECLKPDFYLGSAKNKNHYVQHYIDQYSNMESKPMRITHRVGIGPRIERCTVDQNSLSSRQIRAQFMLQQQEFLLQQRMLMKRQQRINQSRVDLGQKMIDTLRENMELCEKQEEERRQRRLQRLRILCNPKNLLQLIGPLDIPLPGNQMVSYVPGNQMASHMPANQMTSYMPGNQMISQMPGGQMVCDLPNDQAPCYSPGDQMVNQIPSDQMISQMLGGQMARDMPGDNMLAMGQQMPPFDQTVPNGAFPQAPNNFVNNANYIQMDHQSTPVMAPIPSVAVSPAPLSHDQNYYLEPVSEYRPGTTVYTDFPSNFNQMIPTQNFPTYPNQQ